MYVLDARLQDSGGADLPSGIPEQGLRYTLDLGHSLSHTGSAALVLNLRTGLVSSQYHTVIDDDFLMVPCLRAGTVPSNWMDLVDNTREKSADGFYDIMKTWFEAESPTPHAPPSAGPDAP